MVFWVVAIGCSVWLSNQETTAESSLLYILTLVPPLKVGLWAFFPIYNLRSLFAQILYKTCSSQIIFRGYLKSLTLNSSNGYSLIPTLTLNKGARPRCLYTVWISRLESLVFACERRVSHPTALLEQFRVKECSNRDLFGWHHINTCLCTGPGGSPWDHHHIYSQYWNDRMNTLP